MRALVDSAVFDSNAVDASDLVSLFQIALRGPHAVFPEPYEAPEFKAWLGQRDPKIREECRFALELSLDQQKRVQPSFEIRITLTNKPRWDEPAELPLEEALRFLQLPLEIVFENGRNDRHFLFAVADHHQRGALRNALAERRIRFDHGGGLEEMLEHLKEVAKDPMRTRRSFWIFDSDALAPKHPSPTSRKLHQNCRRRRIGCHQLRRRSAESYLPVPAIRELWAQQDAVRKKRIRAFEKLNPLVALENRCFTG